MEDENNHAIPTPNSKSKWIQFKIWCYNYHREIALVMMIILIIIGIWFNPFEEIKEQTGGVAFGIGSALGATSSAGRLKSLGNEGTNIGSISKLSNLGGSEKANELRQSGKVKGAVREGGKGIRAAAGEASDYVMSKFRDNSSIIYEVVYQIAFVIIILLVVFPAGAFFIIALICFVIFRSKLDYLKSL